VTRPLAGLTIVVTRPAAQAGRFLELARLAGANCIAFPTLEIVRLPVTPATRERVLGTDWDWAIYTSTNAVDAALATFGRLPGRRRAAVGRATARALAEHGATTDLRPGTANSEGLLAAPELNSPRGERVLLVKGQGGRDLLRETLLERGAEVVAVEVYRRSRAQPDERARAQLAAALDGAAANVVVAVTSAEVLESLLQLVDAPQAEALRRVALLVPGPRVAAAAASAGWQGPVLHAATAEDEAMLRALEARGAGGASPP
jgi:uroporphyrinogen-III synthase